jgi:hypothetical protein
MAKEQLNKSSLKAAKFPELEKELINYIKNMESRNTAILVHVPSLQRPIY